MRRRVDNSKMALKNRLGGHGFSGSGYKYVAGFCEHGIEHSSTIKCGNFLSSQGTKLFIKILCCMRLVRPKSKKFPVASHS
jgi:hypothetical protein